MTRMLLLAAMALAVLLGCAAGEPPPDWSVRAAGHLTRFKRAYLEGRQVQQAREFQRAREEAASTGRADLVGRVELTRCALQVASLDFDDCPGFQALAGDAGTAERAYHRYLMGTASAQDAPLLPARQQALARGDSRLEQVDDPLSRLVAAGVLVRQGRASAEVLEQAQADASEQGWRRPLLAWLGLQHKQALAAGDPEQAEQLQRRMDLVAPVNPR